MVSLLRVASFTGLLIAAMTLYGCGGSGSSPSSSGGDMGTGDGAMTGDPGTSDGDMDPGGGDMPAPDQLSNLTAPYDVTPEGVDEMLPPGSTHLIEDIAAAQMRAGGTPLEHPRARYTHGGNRIVSSGNTLIVGPRVGNWDRRLPEFTCTGDVCTSNPPETPFQSYLSDLTAEPKVFSKVMAKNGISLLQLSLREDWDIEEYYGHEVLDGLTLMSDVAVGETFYSTGESTEKATGNSGQFAIYSHHAGGFGAGTNPVGNAIYRGIMAGSVVEKDDTVDLNVPEWVIGDAELSFDLATLELDATFSNIVALENSQTFADLEWTGISVNNGAFKQVVVESENYIEGAFFGSNHEGAAGVFEQASIHGSFSAMDTTADAEPGLTDVDIYTVQNLSQARTAAGGTAPDFTVEEYATAASTIFEEASTFLASHRLASWTRDLPYYDCEGRVCNYDDGEEVFEDRLDDYVVDAGGHEALMNKNDIDVVQFAVAYEYGEGVNSGSNVRYGLGLWGQENIAWTFFDHGYGYYGRYEYYESRIAGDSPGSNPSGDATYTGVMAGSVVEKDSAFPLNTPDWVMGDAALTFSLADSTLGASFTNIVSLASGTAHDDLSWENVSVMDGAFDHGGTGDYLNGAFFGTGHEEVAGAFEQDSIAGVFQARQ